LLEYLEKHKKKVLYTPFTIYWLLLLTATSLPGKDLPNLGVSDKIEHFTAYFILSFFLSIVLMLQKRVKILKEKAIFSTLVIVGIYAALDELHQLFIPGRSCDIRDWLTDIIAACIAVFVVSLLTKKNHVKQ